MSRFDSYQQGTPSWIEHSSQDQQASKDFYGQLFDWQFDDNPMTDDQGNEVGTYSMATMGEDRIAGLGPVMSPDQQASWGVYLATDDVDAAAQKVEQAGGQVTVPPMDVMEHGRMAWVQDPAGANVGLWQAKQFAGSQRANEPGTLIWNELSVPDFEQVAPFYESVLGLGRSSAPMGEDAEGAYNMFTVEGREVAGHFPPPADGSPPHWNVYFNVADTDAAVAKAQQLGATEVAPPMDLPGTGRLAFLQDPQGAMFNLMGPLPDDQQQ